MDCDDRARLATATIGANNRPTTFGNAVSEGVASGVVRGMEEVDLAKSCMGSKGLHR